MRKPTRDPILWLIGLALLGLLVLFTARAPDPFLGDQYIGWYGSIVWGILGIVGPWVALPRLETGRERTFWLLWSFVYAMSLSIDVLLVVTWSGAEGAVVEDAMYALLYLSVLVAFWLAPHRLTTPPFETTRLDAVELMGGVVFVGTLLVYFVVVPDLVTPTAYVKWVPSLLLFISLDLFLLGYAIHSFRGAPPGRWRTVYGWLVAGMAFWLLGDTMEAFHVGGVAPWLDIGSPVDIVWQLVWALPIVAGRLRGEPDSQALRAEPRAEASLMRPSLLLMLVLALPFIHFGSDLLGLLPPETLAYREVAILVGLTILLGLAFVHQGLMRTLATHTEQQRTLLAAAVEHSPDAVVIAGPDRRVVYANRAFGSEGSGPEVGRPLLDALVPKGGRWRGPDGESPFAEDGTGKGRIILENEDGGNREYVITISPVTDEGGAIQHFVGVRRDVSREATLETQLRHSQTMEALGTLAGGIAHDFNNILAAVSGYAEFLEMDLPEDSPWQDDVRGILTGTERAAELVRKILMFSRTGWEDRKSHDAGELVGEAVMLLRASLPSTVEVRTDFDVGVGPVWADAHQVHQVVLNLGANATHAMEPTGGTLTISLSTETFSGTDTENPGGLEPGRYVRLTVTDTGKGMDPVTMRRAFDPFFTTKDVGKGTGLGLSMVHGVVAGHGGAVVLESEPGTGTSVHLFFPPADSDQALVADAGRVRTPWAPGLGRILLVDDEPSVSRALGKVLEARGWHVVAVTSSGVALERVQARPEAFDYVLTDMTMPEMTGPELAREVKAVRPDLPVVLMSGFGDSLTLSEGLPASIDAFLRKPSTADEVERVLRGLIPSGVQESPPG